MSTGSLLSSYDNKQSILFVVTLFITKLGYKQKFCSLLHLVNTSKNCVNQILLPNISLKRAFKDQLMASSARVL